MKNLIKAIETEEKKRLEDFIFQINTVTDLKGLDTWQYNDLLPKGKNVDNFSFNALKGYLIMRKEKSIYKAIEREVNKVKTVFNAGKLLSVKISIECKDILKMQILSVLQTSIRLNLMKAGISFHYFKIKRYHPFMKWIENRETAV